MGNGTVRYAPGTGTNLPSDTYYNFALVYTDGQLTGSVDNISGSSADIDLVFSSPVPSEDDRERTTTIIAATSRSAASWRRSAIRP